MAEFAEEFAHGGEHLANDDRQAKLTLGLLALIAPFVAWLVIVSVRAM
ncbi:MAG: hypothetical protein JNL83_20735 [Myxococcales bacterium]|nr:hypothetical protein [Myxococcales bacterium]